MGGITVNYGCNRSLSAVKWLQVSMRREKLEFSPVFARNIPHWDPTTKQQHNLGYIRLANFSQKAAHDMDAAIHELQVGRVVRLTLQCSCVGQVHPSSLCWPHCGALVRALPLKTKHAQAAGSVPDARHEALLRNASAGLLGATALRVCQGFCPEICCCALQKEGADAFILDLRNNPGGLVRAGLDIARLWLPGETPILNVEGRDVEGQTAVVQARASEGWAACMPHRMLPRPVALPVLLPVSGTETAPHAQPWSGQSCCRAAALKGQSEVPAALVAELDCSQSLACLTGAVAGSEAPKSC